jgi:hypothetical protein
LSFFFSLYKLSINFGKIGLGYFLGDIFQPRLATLASSQSCDHETRKTFSSPGVHMYVKGHVMDQPLTAFSSFDPGQKVPRVLTGSFLLLIELLWAPKLNFYLAESLPT